MYTVKILSSEEFDKLPFSRAKEALGAADPKTNIAYVRDTGYNDVTKHTIEHELDELMQKTSPHEIDGIRYKIPVIGPLFSGLGKAAGAVGSGIGNVAGAIGKGAGAIGSGVKNFVSGGGVDKAGSFGRIGDFFSGASKAPTFTAASQAGFPKAPFSFAPPSGAALRAGPLINAGGSFPSSVFSFAPPSGSVLSRASGQGGGVVDFFQGLGKSLLGGFAPGEPGGAPTGFPTTGQTQQQGEGTIMDRLFKAGVPALAGLLGDRLAPKPDELDFSGVTNSLRDRITGDALSPLFAAGERELLQDLSDPTVAPPEEAFARGDSIIREDLADNIENLRNQFKQLNPNANVENNTAFLAEKSRLEERARERRAQMRDEQSFNFVREQLNRDLSEIQTALNLDNAQTSQLIQIAQLDVAEIVNRYGLQLQEAAEFKELFGNFGQILAGNNQNQQPIFNLGGV